MRSQILRGTVRHRRGRHTTYDFTHHVWYLAVDLDELPLISRFAPVLGYERGALLQVRDADHVTRPPLDLAASVRAHLAERGIDATRLHVSLIAYPRAFGYVFNPVSFYLCRDAERRLVHVIAEVHNTHGDRELYDFAPAAAGAVFRSTATKRMYVSPFIAPDARYELNVSDLPDRLVLSIREFEGDALTLYARIDVRPQALTRRHLFAALARDPLVPARTIALIGWHAARLRLRGLRWQRHRRRAKSAPR